MKQKIIFLFGFILLIAFGSSLAQETPRVLVLQMNTSEVTLENDALNLANELSNAINRVGAYDVVTKNSPEIERIYIEHKKTIPIFMDESSKKDLGIWLNADFVIGGSLSKIENKYSINLGMVDVKQGVTVSIVQLSVKDFNHKLFLNRLAQLLLWARVRITSNRSPYEVVLDGKILSEEMKDVDYNVWLVEPNKKHSLQVKTDLKNYAAYKEDFLVNIAESKVVEAKLKYQMGVLNIQSSPEADVYLNDEMIGETPLQKEVHEGEYMLTLKSSRHDNINKYVIISPEETTFVKEILPVNNASYRRNGIISALGTALFVAGGLYAKSEANKSYDQYLVTMDTEVMNDRMDKAKTFDALTYVGYGVAGGFAIWSILEWIGLITTDEPSEISNPALRDNQWFNLSITNKGLTLSFQIF